jgi:hypothetical protein
MKYIITEDQHERLFESDNYQKRWNKFVVKMKRRSQLIDDLIGRTLVDENPNDWDDMYDYAGYIIREVSGEIMYGESGVYSDGDDEFELEAWIDNYIKDNFGLRIFEYYMNSRED